MGQIPFHTPYDGSSKPFTIALKPLDVRDWMEVDDRLVDHLAEKDKLFAERKKEYEQARSKMQSSRSRITQSTAYKQSYQEAMKSSNRSRALTELREDFIDDDQGYQQSVLAYESQ